MPKAGKREHETVRHSPQKARSVFPLSTPQTPQGHPFMVYVSSPRKTSSHHGLRVFSAQDFLSLSVFSWMRKAVRFRHTIQCGEKP